MMLTGKTNKDCINTEKEEYFGEDGLLYCGICHEPKEAFYPPGKDLFGKRKHPRMCVCHREECKRLEQRAKQMEHDRMVSLLRERCFSDKNMYNWRFENDNGLNQKMNVAREYADSWEENEKENRGLNFWGGVGTGKSYMAGCIANELLEKEVTVRMTNFAEILNELNSHDTDRNEYIQSLCRARLLIIDDLGMERSTDYGLEQVYNVIDARCRSNKPLIITTNLSLQEMKNENNMARKRIYDRILAMCIPVQVQGINMRQIEQKEKFRKFTEKKA